MAIAPIGSIGANPIAPADAGQKSSGGFGSVLSDAMNQVGAMHQDSAQSVERFLAGEGDDLHKTILATQRAELAMELFLQVRNKVVQAYQEVMRMQV
jgi:flagellar hook-basal body complex protein FliE